MDTGLNTDMDQNKTPKIVFAEGCFDNFEGTQQELDQLILDIQTMIESGALFEKAQPLSEVDLDSLPESLRQEILREMDDTDVAPQTKRTLQ